MAIRTLFCSHPAEVCISHLETSEAHSILPQLTYAFSSALEPGLPQPNISCLDQSTLLFQGNVSDPGMAYEFVARASVLGPAANVSCIEQPQGLGRMNATLIVMGAQQSWITWAGDTEYDMDAGSAAYNFSFRRADGVPRSVLISRIVASAPAYDSVFATHVHSYRKFLGGFDLSLGQAPDLARSTDELKAAYQTDVGDPYLEWVLFNYGRYLLTSSAPGTLPANLQGKWASDISNPWSADYRSFSLYLSLPRKAHRTTDSNINIQMNYWFAELTNMDLVTPLFDYIEVRRR